MSRKSQLNLYCQKSHINTASYTTEKKGDVFVSEVTVSNIPYKSIEGHSTKKEAENGAAAVALQALVQLRGVKSIEDLLKMVDAEMNSKQQKKLAVLDSLTSSPTFQSSTESPLARMQVPTMPVTQAHSLPVTVSLTRTPQPQQPACGPRPALAAALPPASGLRMSVPGPHGAVQPVAGPQQPSPRPALAAALPGLRMSVPGPHGAVHPVAGPGAYMQPYPRPSPLSGLEIRPPSTSSFPLHALFTHDSNLVAPPLPSQPQIVPEVVPMVGQGASSPPSRNLPNRSAVSQSKDVPIMMSALIPHSLPNRELITPPPVHQQVAQTQRVSPVVPYHQQQVAQVPHTQPPAQHHQQQMVQAHIATKINFGEALERYCQQHGFPTPVYKVIENHKRFSSRVVVGWDCYDSAGNYESFELAKEVATLVALASIGLQVLQVGEKVPPTCNPVQQNPVQQQLLTVTESSGISQQHSQTPQKSFLTEASLSKTQGIPSQQHPASPASLVAASGSVKLQTPSYFYAQANSRALGGFPSRGGSGASHKPATTVTALTESLATAVMSNTNYKVTLNTFCQKNGISPPQYDCEYPEDAVGYIARVTVQNRVFQSSTEGTKRGAESKAAALALKSFGVSLPEEGEEVANGYPVQASVEESSTSIEAQERTVSYKNLLQEFLQKSHASLLPRYETERTENGFISTVAVRITPDKTERFTGKQHANKRASEQECAKEACYALKIVT